MKEELDFSNLIKNTATTPRSQREDSVVEFSSKMMTGLRKKAKENKVPLGLLLATFSEGFKKAQKSEFSPAVYGLQAVNKTSDFKLEYELDSLKGSEHITEVDLLAMDESLLKEAEEEIREWGILNDKNFSDLDELYLEVDARQDFIKSHL